MADELVLVELVHEGALSNLDVPELAAILSTFVAKGKLPQGGQRLTPALAAAKELLVATTHRLGAMQEVAPDDHERAVLNFAMVEVAYHWAAGMPFVDICGYTPLLEGDIVRGISRLEEVCKEARQVARALGDTKLFEKLEDVSTAIRRDIAFAASLYTS